MQNLSLLIWKDTVVKLKWELFIFRDISLEIVLFSEHISWNETDENIYLLLNKIFDYNWIDKKYLTELNPEQIKKILDINFEKIEKIKSKWNSKWENIDDILLLISFFIKWYDWAFNLEDVLKLPYNIFLRMYENIWTIWLLSEWKSLKEIKDMKKDTPDLKWFKDIIK